MKRVGCAGGGKIASRVRAELGETGIHAMFSCNVGRETIYLTLSKWSRACSEVQLLIQVRGGSVSWKAAHGGYHLSQWKLHQPFRKRTRRQSTAILPARAAITT